MNPTRPSGIFGSVGTFVLLLTAAGFWFAAAGFSRFTPDTGETLSLVALLAALAAVVLFALTVRSILFASDSSRDRPRRRRSF
jgi:hypothetical protein